MHKFSLGTFLWLALSLTLAAGFSMSAAQAQAASTTAPATLPGGASSLQETFGDWQIACVVQGAAKRCTLSQEQVNQQTHQRVFMIEIANTGDKLEGVLLMPFGLALDHGVTLQIDDQPTQIPLKFRTCLPGGCLVQLNFDGKSVAALKVGTVLKARVAADGGQDQLYTVSLKGFAQALDRVSVLAK